MGETFNVARMSWLGTNRFPSTSPGYTAIPKGRYTVPTLCAPVRIVRRLEEYSVSQKFQCYINFS
jgi:hypothetical protein